MLPDALQVTSMAQTGLRAVVLIGAHALDLVVVTASRDPLHSGRLYPRQRRAPAAADYSEHHLLLLTDGECEWHGAGFSILQVEIDEEIVR